MLSHISSTLPISKAKKHHKRSTFVSIKTRKIQMSGQLTSSKQASLAFLLKTRGKKRQGGYIPHEHGISYRKNKKNNHGLITDQKGKIGIPYERCFYDLATKVVVHRRKILRYIKK